MKIKHHRIIPCRIYKKSDIKVCIERFTRQYTIGVKIGHTPTSVNPYVGSGHCIIKKVGNITISDQFYDRLPTTLTTVYVFKSY